MNSLKLLGCAALWLNGAHLCSVAPAPVVASQEQQADSIAGNRDSVAIEPPEIHFKDFFNPIGDRGLSLTGRLLGLNGTRIRIRGYVVREDKPCAGRFLLTSLPVQLHGEYGMADDLPPATVFVTVPRNLEAPQPKTGLLLLAGTLEIGNREEPDGRTSLVRLTLDSLLQLKSRP